MTDYKQIIDIPVAFRHPNGEIVAAITPGSVEGPQFATLWLVGCDVEGVRNFQMGALPTSKGGDISVGGDNSSPEQPRMWLGVQFDNGNGTVMYDGRKREIMSFRGNDDVTKNQARVKAPLLLMGGAKIPYYMADGVTVKGWKTVIPKHA